MLGAMCYYLEFWEHQVDIIDFGRRSIAGATKRRRNILSNGNNLLIRKLSMTYPIFENEVWNNFMY